MARQLAERYDIAGELGRGGMSTVYLAYERATGRAVAIKLMNQHHAANPEAVRRFAREARTVATLHHPNIVETIAIEELAASELAIVNAHVDGQTLRDVLHADGAFPVDRTLRVLRDVASALAHAHANRIVHRDVKPANIFLETRSGRALLADFGIARALDDHTLVTMAGFVIGTPAYMAPELVVGHDVDERADVYALGLLGWEMLTGRAPWQGETLYAVLHKQQHEHLPDLAVLRPDTPAFLYRALSVALAKDPEGRWRDAGEFFAQLFPAPVPSDAIATDAHESDATVHIERPRCATDEPQIVDAFREVVHAPSMMNLPRLSLHRRALLSAALTVAGAAGLALFLPGLSRATARGHAAVDPQLDTLLTQAAIVPYPARASGATVVRRAAGNPVCDTPSSTAQRTCLFALVSRHEDSLTRAYGALIAAQRRGSGQSEPPSVRALRAEERAWIAARDRACRARTRATEGPLWGVARAPCFAMWTDARTAELRRRAAKLVQGRS